MGLKFKGDITHTEKYTDKKSGEEKKKYTRIGALFEREDGSFTVKMLDSWLNVYPPKASEEDFRNLRESIDPDTGEIQGRDKDDLGSDIPF